MEGIHTVEKRLEASRNLRGTYIILNATGRVSTVNLITSVRSKLLLFVVSKKKPSALSRVYSRTYYLCWGSSKFSKCLSFKSEWKWHDSLERELNALNICDAFDLTIIAISDGEVSSAHISSAEIVHASELTMHAAVTQNSSTFK